MLNLRRALESWCAALPLILIAGVVTQARAQLPPATPSVPDVDKPSPRDPAAGSGVIVDTKTESTLELRLERALGAGRANAKVDPARFSRADRISGELDERIRLEGNAEVRAEGAVLRGDLIDYQMVSDVLSVQGNARLFQNGTAFFGPSLRLRLETLTGQMNDAGYTYAPREGRGRAARIEFLGEEKVRMHNATFTTCGPGDDAWWVRAETLELDRFEELGVGQSAKLYFQGVPILASPYFQFPLGERRRSGLLTPGFAINSKLGPEVTIPYYWDIAPNRDLTIAPRIMTRRGVLFGTEARYLEPSARGNLVYDFIPQDRDFGGARQYTSFQHDQALPAGVMAGVNYNHVSDDRFFVDFAKTIVTASPAVLPQEAYLTYGQTYWSSALRVTKNQALLSLLTNGINDKPYEREPQLTLNATRYDWQGLDLAAAVDLTRFTHPTLENGTRTVFNPSVSAPLVAPGYFIVPKLQWHLTHYELDPAARGTSSAQRSLPIASLDTGLVFERPTNWFGDDVTQTLEPRAYYAYVPYRDQSALPNFDSAAADFNFAQLFTENVYSGADRIGEANQLTTALVSRILDPRSGTERLRAAVGQRFYYSPQRVVLPGGTQRTAQASDVLFSVSGNVANRWVTDLSLQYSTLNHQSVATTFGVRWQPRAASTLAVSYRYKVNELEQLDIAAQWPLSKRWYGVGRINYSLPEDRWIEALAGFEYKADCWVGRIVAQRFATALQTATTTVFFQLELNGLASVGTSPVEQLRRNIPGYQLINPPPISRGRFEDYE